MTQQHETPEVNTENSPQNQTKEKFKEGGSVRFLNLDPINILTIVVSILTGLFTIGTIIIAVLGVSSFLDFNNLKNNYRNDLESLKKEFNLLSIDHKDGVEKLKNEYNILIEKYHNDYNDNIDNISNLTKNVEEDYKEFKIILSETSGKISSIENNMRSIREILFVINRAREDVRLDKDIDSLDSNSIKETVMNFNNASRIFSRYILKDSKYNKNEYGIEVVTEATWNYLKLMEKSGEKILFKRVYEIYLTNIEYLENLTSEKNGKY